MMKAESGKAQAVQGGGIEAAAGQRVIDRRQFETHPCAGRQRRARCEQQDQRARQQPPQHAGGGGGNLDRDLVGFQLAEHFIRGDGVAANPVTIAIQ